MYDISQLARSSRGLTRVGVAFAVFALGAGSMQFGVEAQEDSARSPRGASSARVEPEHHDLLQRNTQKREKRWSKSNLTVIRRPNGKELLTNNPEQYTNRPGYVVVSSNGSRIPTKPVRPTSRVNSLSGVRAVNAVRGIPEDIQRHVTYYARINDLPESLVYAVIKAESAFVATARSNKGAQGLMQLMPATAADLGVRNPYDAGENIRGGTQYLAMMLDRFDNDLHLALAGYNAGPETVKDYGGIPPYKETLDFVQRVIRNMTDFTDGGASLASRPASSTIEAEPAVLRDRRDGDFVIYFKSGHEQQASDVIDHGDEYYIVKYKGRSFRVKKSQVRSVQKGA